jgi:hypothetical protein
MNIYDKIRRKTGKVLPRRFHCYCIGAAKTATTSISSMFEHNFDSRHEANIQATNHNIIDYLENKITQEQMLDHLKERDQQLQLELESTHSLIYVANELSSLFPDAKFIVTVREPMDWIRSRINFHFKKHPPEWEEYRQYFWMDKTEGYADEEALLKENDLASLDAYLSQYAQHYSLVAKNIPQDRRLIIRMGDISHKNAEIAEFLGIKASKIVPEHSNSQPNIAAFIDPLDQQFVIQKIWHHCQDLIEEFFPEQIPYYQEMLGNTPVTNPDTKMEQEGIQ